MDVSGCLRLVAPRSRRKLLLLAGAVLFALALHYNFSSESSTSFFDKPDTGPQMYEPTYPHDPSQSFGVIYAGNGTFVDKAYASALALGPGANATIFTDMRGVLRCKKLRARFRKESQHRLHQQIDCQGVGPKAQSWGFRAAKLFATTVSPYDKSLYIDADAYPCQNYEWLRKQLSPALERYDILTTHSSMRIGPPYALHWLNAGVIAFNKRPAASAVMARWLTTYTERKLKPGEAPTDQRLFNEAVLESGARAMVLPPEYNCKSNYKSIRYEWSKSLSPAYYHYVRHGAPCCSVRSLGECVIDHECKFPSPGGTR